MKTNLLKKFILIFFTLATVAAFVTVTRPIAYADNSQKAELEKKIAGINEELKEVKLREEELKKTISATSENLKTKKNEADYLGTQVANTQYEINLLSNKISLLEDDIDIKKDEVDNKLKEYENKYDQYLKRVRAMYMYDSSTTMGLILGTDDFVDYLSIADNMSRISKYDNSLMDEMLAEKSALEAEKKKLEEAQSDLEVTQKETQTKRNQLSTQHSAIMSQVQDIETLKKEHEADLAAYKKKAAAMESEVAKIYEQIKLSEEAYIGGGVMAWPVPGYSHVSSQYGWRFNGTDYHTGIDIAGGSKGGIHGKPVVAANDGTVVAVNTSHRNGVGYGIYVMIDHGGTITTLYAHLSSIAVSNGQKVTRGQTIGSVGSTGWSTGPHLHFEVRKGKSHINPNSYLY